MKLRFVHNLKRVAHKDAWKATCDGLPYTGIGRTQAEAMDSLVRANYAAFGIEEMIVEDPTSLVPFTRWTAENARDIAEWAKRRREEEKAMKREDLYA